MEICKFYNHCLLRFMSKSVESSLLIFELLDTSNWMINGEVSSWFADYFLFQNWYASIFVRSCVTILEMKAVTAFLFCFLFPRFLVVSLYLALGRLSLFKRSNTHFKLIFLGVPSTWQCTRLPDVYVSFASYTLCSICLTLSDLVSAGFWHFESNSCEVLPWYRLSALLVKFYPDLGVQLNR